MRRNPLQLLTTKKDLNFIHKRKFPRIGRKSFRKLLFQTIQRKGQHRSNLIFIIT